MPAVTCFFSPQSGYAYLGHEAFCGIAEEAGADILWRPVDIGAVFAASGTVPPARQSPARIGYRKADMARFAARRGLAFNPEPRVWPVPTDLACRLIAAAQARGGPVSALIGAVLAGVWARDLDIADPETLSVLAGEAGYSGAALLAEARGDAAGEAVRAFTADAVAQGVFGSPTYIVEGQMFWGQDRLDFVAEALVRKGRGAA